MLYGLYCVGNNKDGKYIPFLIMSLTVGFKFNG
jgi:hypothetical protein